MWSLSFCLVTYHLFSSAQTAVGTKSAFSQLGAPFHFAKPSAPLYRLPLSREDKTTIWWPATGRPPKLRRSIHPRLPVGEGILHSAVAFPDPFIEPARCVSLINVDHAWLCDPDKLLTPVEQAELEIELLKLRDTTQHTCKNGKKRFYQAAVAVASDIVVGENETPQQAADHFSHVLLRRWGIGNKECHDGLLILCVKNLRVVSLATREGVESQFISDEFKKDFNHQVQSTYVVTGSMDRALKTGVELLRSQLPTPHAGVSTAAKIIIALLLVYCVSVATVYCILTTVLSRKYAHPE